MKTSVALASAALLTIGLVHAQAPASNTRGSSYSAPRTPWGDPDLQGTYTNGNESGIPMARPAEFAGKRPEDVTPAEVARLAQERASRIEKTAHSWTRPWSFGMLLTRDPQSQVFEYACHEGNEGMRNMLKVARDAEKRQ